MKRRPESGLIERIAARIPDAPDAARPGRAQLASVTASIARDFQPVRIILFGSRAAGNACWESDIDLMVVMDTRLRPVDQAVLIRQSLDLRPSFSFDVLVRTPEQIANGLSEGDSFIDEVVTRGATLYEAADIALG